MNRHSPTRFPRGWSSHRARIGAALAVVLTAATITSGVGGLFQPAQSGAELTTGGQNPARTNWFGNEGGLTPGLVSGGTFGRLFSTAVQGQVYSEPIVSENTLLVATEANHAYGLDPATGAVRWDRDLGTPWASVDIGCADLAPTVGVTGTPVVDAASGTEYLLSKTYANGTSGPARWWAHAIEITTGKERPGFPLAIEGTAQNIPGLAFSPTTQHQRPGLLLLDGVIYAGFGGHCDAPPYTGWVVGISPAARITAMWASASGASGGAGIWAPGGGLLSDGPGRIFVATGNGVVPPIGATPGTTDYGQAVVRLAVQPDGSLSAADFFAPYDAEAISEWDADLGSGGPVALPSSFGSADHPHLLLQTGKQGYVYLLDRDHLGGRAEGTQGGDAVVSRAGPDGGVWGTPAVWPGDGGWVYVPTVSSGTTAGGTSGFLHAYRLGRDANGTPGLSLQGTAPGAFGFGSGSPSVSSNGTSPGSGLVWIVWSADGTGANAQLRAYDAVPTNGALNLRFSAPLGTASKFSNVAIDNRRVYVGTRDGHILGFGSPVSTPLTGSAIAFPSTTVGNSTTVDAVLTATRTTTVNALHTSDPAFTVGDSTPHAPVTLTEGQTLRVSVSFAPRITGLRAALLTVETSDGPATFDLTGTGRPLAASPVANPPTVSFGGVALGSSSATSSITLTNAGASPLTINGVVPPGAPFTTASLPDANTILAPDASIAVQLGFAPTTLGAFDDELTFQTNVGDVTVSMSGSAGAPPVLQITPSDIDAGSTRVGTATTASFTLTNNGGTAVTIMRSKPPAGGNGFIATSTLAEGTVIPAAGSLVETVRFAPTTEGPHADVWTITGNDSSGLHTVTLRGEGTLGGVPAPWSGGWQLNGAATTDQSSLTLTPATEHQAGSAFWPTPLATNHLHLSTDVSASNGTGADGMTITFADPARNATPTNLGLDGGGLGYAGIPGTAIAIDTYQNAEDPSGNFLGITNGLSTTVTPEPGQLHWLTTTTKVPEWTNGTHHLEVSIDNGHLTVAVDGIPTLDTTVNLPATALLGFTAATGGLSSQHTLTNTRIDLAPNDPTPAPAWQLNGSATRVGDQFVLTPAASHRSGSAFWPAALDTDGLAVEFDMSIDRGSGADGITLTLADASGGATPLALGNDGGGLGFTGIPGGTAVAFDTFANAGDPPAPHVGIASSSNEPDRIQWGASAPVAALRGGTRHVIATVHAGKLTVAIDGATVLDAPIALPARALLGFTAGTGGLNDRQTVSGVRVGHAVAAPTAGGWQLNGAATATASSLTLTPAIGHQAGSAFWPTPLATNHLHLSTDVTAANGTGADGLTITLADPARGAASTNLGFDGGGLGYAGIPGTAIALDTYQNPLDPSANFLGISDGPDAEPGQLHWLTTTTNVPQWTNGTHHLEVTIDNGHLTIAVDGIPTIDTTVNLPATALLGFTAATGGLTNRHTLTNTHISTT